VAIVVDYCIKVVIVGVESYTSYTSLMVTLVVVMNTVVEKKTLVEKKDQLPWWKKSTAHCFLMMINSNVENNIRTGSFTYSSVGIPL
jgi:hypothetical protein